MPTPPHSEIVTQGIRVHAAAQFLPEESEPDEQRFVYGYRITLTNEGARPAQLLSRHWVILDAEGRRRDVKGPGVVGRTPRLETKERFSYTSFSPLATKWGTMEGSFTFRYDDDSTFDVAVGRFLLVPTAPALDLASSGT
jgi:ApaG protein